jgi:diketogulonate reductase-like aldo/keto reductase
VIPFGQSGMAASRVGQGTFLMEHDDPQAVVAALQAGMDLGLTHLDTAEMYGGGRVEELVGRALRGRRERAFVVTKVLPGNATRAGTLKSCAASLRRLGTDYIDCYLLHWPGSHPLADTFAAFEELRVSGAIRSYGVSNFDETELEAAAAIVGSEQLACNQVLYHLDERSSERSVIPWCEARSVAVVGYTPFGRAAFPPPGGAVALENLARARGVTTRQLALAYLTRRPGLFTIPKASTRRHVEENAAAAALVLEDSEVRSIEAAFPLGPARAGVARI